MTTVLLRLLMRPGVWIAAACLLALADLTLPSDFAVYVLATALLPIAWQTLHRRHVPLISSVLMVSVALPATVEAAIVAFGGSAPTASKSAAIAPAHVGLEAARIWTLAGLSTAGLFHFNLQRLRRRRLNLRRELQQRVRRRTDQVRRANQALRAEVARRQETENLLDRSENRFKALMDRMQLQVTRKNPDGVFTYANETFCRTLGLRAADVIGRTDADLFSPELARAYRADDVRVMKLAQSVDQVEEHPSVHGESGFVQVFKAPEYDQEGHCVGVQIIFWDITQKHRSEMALRDSEARKRALFEASGDAMMLVDAGGRVVEANRSAGSLFHVSSFALVGRPIDDVAVPSLSDSAMVETTVRGLPRSADQSQSSAPIRWNELPKAYRHALRLRRTDGTEFESEVSIHSIPVGNGEGMAIIVRDVTLQRRAFETLRRAKAAAEEANRTKTEFMAGVSHELRTPLGGIIGLSELLADSDLSPRDQQYTKLIQHSASLLTDVIEDILDFAAIEAGRLKIAPAPLDLYEVVSEAFGCLTSRTREQPLRLILSIAPTVPRYVTADAKRVRQIITNLAGNAIKFTPSGEVELRLACAEVESTDVGNVPIVIEVRDTGIGIPEAKQAQVFEAFERAEEGTTRVYGGTGLGLSISQKLAERMGGGIELESKVGEGSTFRCRISVALNEGVTAPPRQRVPRINELVIDTGSLAMDAAFEELVRKHFAPQVSHLSPSDGPDPSRAPVVGGGTLFILSDLGKTTVPRGRIGGKDRVVWIQQIGWPAPRHALSDEPVLIEPVSPDALIDAIADPANVASRQSNLNERSDASAPGALVPSDRGRILLVDDSEVNRIVIHDMLARRQFHVDIAPNGKRALEWLIEDANRPTEAADAVGTAPPRPSSQLPYDCVLMDLQMPDMDGTEVAQRAQEVYRRSGNAPPPIIALTAHVTEEHRRLCGEAGMVGFLTKPIAPTRLLEEIARHLPKRHPARVCSPQAGNAAVSDGRDAGHEKQPDDDAAPQWKERMMMHGGHQAEIVASLCDAFLTEVPSLIKRSRRAISSGDDKSLKTAAHTIKSCLRYVADDCDVELAANMERRAGHAERVTDEQIDELETVCEVWMARVRQLHREQQQELSQR